MAIDQSPMPRFQLLSNDRRFVILTLRFHLSSAMDPEFDFQSEEGYLCCSVIYASLKQAKIVTTVPQILYRVNCLFYVWLESLRDGGVISQDKTTIFPENRRPLRNGHRGPTIHVSNLPPVAASGYHC
eukprot:Gregarina_sp_Poly_1__9966@NODE_65_length_16489_cov_69_850445_g56_i0_p7_GENE_NODE_65_length_16489_cov_69_850445_g56_i0NODE_65_length_16489_cov_69_850445_g56_i0_p7_ORF_typecomplete_len128_score9_95_NODE_65_length_16489_cov_69_850445_g56_i026553038